MFSSDELKFAARFPFSDTSRQVLKTHSFSLDRVPLTVRDKAILWIAFSMKPHSKKELEDFFKKRVLASSDVLVSEIQSFPIAKIFLSAMNQPEFYERFADQLAKQVFHYATRESEPEQLFLLAKELGVTVSESEKAGFFGQVSLKDFLQVNFREDFLKLVNRSLENGIVYLNQNDLARFVSELSRERVLSSLPVSMEDVPKELVETSKKLKAQLAVRQRQEFDLKSLGAVEAESFPPCMQKIYSELLAGQNANHAARFNLATFLVAIGMSSEQIVNVFSKAPNFDEKVTRYQVEKIAGRGKARYSPSSCAKMREYELCVANCPVNHPVQFYRQQKQAEKPSVSEPPKPL